MKRKLTCRQFQAALECILIALAVVVMALEMLRPGSVNGLLWACVATMCGIRCIMVLRDLERAEESVKYWQERCRERDNDIALLCRENSDLAARLRSMESIDMDDMK